MKVSTECLIVMLFATVIGVTITTAATVIAIFLFPAYFICRAIEDNK